MLAIDSKQFNSFSPALQMASLGFTPIDGFPTLLRKKLEFLTQQTFGENPSQAECFVIASVPIHAPNLNMLFYAIGKKSGDTYRIWMHGHQLRDALGVMEDKTRAFKNPSYCFNEAGLYLYLAKALDPGA